MQGESIVVVESIIVAGGAEYQQPAPRARAAISGVFALCLAGALFNLGCASHDGGDAQGQARSALAKVSFEGLGFLSDELPTSSGLGVSADGAVVVGGSFGTTTEGFRWESGVIEGLGDATEALDASADGRVIAGVIFPPGESLAVRWVDRQLEILGELPGGLVAGQALAVSADGSVVVGNSFSDIGMEGFRWEDGVMKGLGPAFNDATGVSADGSVIVGYGADEALRLENGVLQTLGILPGHAFSAAYDVSGDGQVVVGYSGSMATSVTEAFRWEGGVMQGLGALPKRNFSRANATSADGSVIVGYSGSMSLGTDAMIWTEAAGMRLLQEVLESDYGLDLSGWVLRVANDVSDDGSVIIGSGVNPEGNTEGWRVSGL